MSGIGGGSFNFAGKMQAPFDRDYVVQEVHLMPAPHAANDASYEAKACVWEHRLQETIEFYVFYYAGIFERGELADDKETILAHARNAVLDWMNVNRHRRPLCTWQYPVILDFS